MERTLSGIERMMYLVAEHTSVNGFMSARVRGPLDEARLRVALDRLPCRHPLLSVRVARERGALVFTTGSVPPIPLRIVSGAGDPSFPAVVAAELGAPLAWSTGPLARLTVLRHPDGERADLIMTMDHTISDGISCLYVIRDLLALHEAPETEIHPVPLPPPVTQLFPRPILGASTPLGPSPDAGLPWTPLFRAATSDIVVASAELPREPMQALAGRCRDHGVTVHAAACAAFGASLAALSGPRTKVTISSPVSYRHRLDPGLRETLSCSVAFADLHVDLSPPGSFWEQARAVRQQVLEWRTDEKLFGASFAIEEVSQAEPDDSRFLHRVSRGVKGHDLSISNLGRQPIPSRHGELTIEAIRSAGCLPGEMVINLCTLDDTMHITLATNGLSRAENDAAHRMVASAVARLRMLPA